MITTYTSCQPFVSTFRAHTTFPVFMLRQARGKASKYDAYSHETSFSRSSQQSTEMRHVAPAASGSEWMPQVHASHTTHNTHCLNLITDHILRSRARCARPSTRGVEKLVLVFAVPCFKSDCLGDCVGIGVTGGCAGAAKRFRG